MRVPLRPHAVREPCTWGTFLHGKREISLLFGELTPRNALGSLATYAKDARQGEVGRTRSTGEANEQTAVRSPNKPGTK